MQKNTLIAAAVAGVLASAAASAKTIDVWASGASAQRTFWQKELGATYCGGTSAVAVYAYGDSTITVDVPDFQAATCIATATVSSAGVTVGDTLNLHYAADLGSVWAIAGSLNTSLTRSQMTVPAASLCTLKSQTSFPISSYTCNTTGYNRSNDTGGTAFLVQHTSDLLLSDLEPALFAQSDNWPTASAGTSNAGPTAAYQGTADTTVTKLATQPTASQLNTVASHMQVLNGEVFSIVGHGIPGNPTGLSHQSLRSIFAGNYSTWSQVPEVGSADTTGTPIIVCRRDHGSGSEIATSVFLEGVECNASGATPIVNAAGAAQGNYALQYVVENSSSGDLKVCLTGLSGTIGLLSLGTSSAYTTFNIDGIQPNAHNSALGSYGFATETWGQNLSTSGTLATALFLAAQKQAQLSTDGFTETGTTVGGQFTVSSGSQQVAYSLPNSYNTSSTANYTAAAPVALFTRGGNSCTTTALNGNST